MCILIEKHTVICLKKKKKKKMNKKLKFIHSGRSDLISAHISAAAPANFRAL